jgi:hypothetical protein
LKKALTTGAQALAFGLLFSQPSVFASDVSTWSNTAAGNNSPLPDGFPVGANPALVDDWGRETMAAIKRWYDTAPTITPVVLTSGSGGAAANTTAINAAITAAAASSTPATVLLPGGDIYFSGTIVPKSNVRLSSIGVTTLHYTGSGNAVENDAATILTRFNWDGIGLDAGNAAIALALHAPYKSRFDLGYACQTNATGAFLKVLADVTAGPTNDASNYNSAFNTFSRVHMGGSGCYTGTAIYLSGAGSPTIPTGIVTLNTFEDMTFLDVRIAGVNAVHWTDTNEFTGQFNISMTGNNSKGLIFNSSADNTKTVYNLHFAHPSIAYYNGAPGVVGIQMGYARGITIDALLFDEVSPIPTRLTIDGINTSSYDITVVGSYGDESIRHWRRFEETTDGVDGGMIRNLPIKFTQTWNNALSQFTEVLIDVTTTAAAIGSKMFSVAVNGVEKFNVDKDGATNVTFLNVLNGSALAGGATISGGLNVTSGGIQSTIYILVRNLFFDTAPTISTGWGASPSIAFHNGTAAFDINVGTGGTAATGQITMPAATNGWSCSAADITTQSATVFLTKQTLSDASHVSFTNYNTAGAVAPWTSGDHLRVACVAM